MKSAITCGCRDLKISINGATGERKEFCPKHNERPTFDGDIPITFRSECEALRCEPWTGEDVDTFLRKEENANCKKIAGSASITYMHVNGYIPICYYIRDPRNPYNSSGWVFRIP
jgi:hypothetical protein